MGGALTRGEAFQLIEEAVNASQGTIQGTESLKDLEWDSMASVSFIGLVDDRLGRVIDATTLASCRTVQDVLRLLGLE